VKPIDITVSWEELRPNWVKAWNNGIKAAINKYFNRYGRSRYPWRGSKFRLTWWAISPGQPSEGAVRFSSSSLGVGQTNITRGKMGNPMETTKSAHTITFLGLKILELALKSTLCWESLGVLLFIRGLLSPKIDKKYNYF